MTFEGFQSTVIDVDATTIALRWGGTGHPVLLLHGFPETHVMWHRVAPALAEDFTVVCADLRGYGASGTPPSTPDHAPYAKAAMAGDMVTVMEHLGFESFSVVGHDRGGRVAYRLALDYANQVEKLAVLDVVPTSEALDRADSRLALGYWPWSLLAQPEPLPERLIAAAADAFVDAALGGWGSDPEAFPDDVRNLYIDALSDPGTAHAICEEYRAAATLDYEADRRDRAAGRQINAPTLVLWATPGPLDDWYEVDGGPVGIWRTWATQVEGQPLPGGHFFPEENPADTVAELRAFLRR
ncbi:MAG TPA: alpha/beta hydrolase [Solirubrobacteraceae bacterium]